MKQPKFLRYTVEDGKMICNLSDLNYFHGALASIPDVHVEQAIKDGLDMLIRYKEQSMFIPKDKVEKTFFRTYKYQWQTPSGVVYGILHAKWKPDENSQEK